MRMRSEYCGFVLAAFAAVANGGTITVNSNSDGAATCPATCTLRQAIAAANPSDTVVFASDLASPITLTQGELVIDKALTIQGPGATVLTVSAQNNSRVFNIAAAATISGLEIADGAVTGGNGGNGADGSGTGAMGGQGDPGVSAGGACVLVASGVAAVLDRVAIRHCYALGGTGGNGGKGGPGDDSDITHPIQGGHGGYGGGGGKATGGAIEVDGTLTLSHASVVDAHGTGGTGGTGGSGGNDVIAHGPGGIGGGGGGADGGAVFAGAGASIHIVNSTIAESSGTGGSGGPGGPAPFPGISGPAGDAIGGLLFVDNSAALADLEFSTLANGTVNAGSGGSMSSLVGNAVVAGTTLTALSSLVVGAQSDITVCSGLVTAAADSVNLSEDTSCTGFTVHASFGQTLLPLDTTTTPWPGYLPVLHGPAMDAAATCLDLASQAVTSDQHGAARPQGAACDLGAIEADYVFVDGFE